MSNDFGQDFAEQLADYFISGSGIDAPPSDAYVTLYDDNGDELDGDLQNGRVGLAVGDDIDEGGDATEFENGVQVDFGEATSDITVQAFALKDSDDTDSNAVEFFRADITDAPQDFAEGTTVFFDAGELTVNILDQGTD